MKMPIFISAILVSFFTGIIKSDCQNTSINAADAVQKDTVLHPKGEKITFQDMAHRGRYMLNMTYFKYGDSEKRHYAGRSGQLLRPYLQKCPEAITELNIFKQETNNKRLLVSGAILSYVGGTALMMFNMINYHNTHPIDPNTGKSSGTTAGLNRAALPPAFIATAGVIICGTMAFTINKKRYQHLRKSVDAYNKWIVSK